MRFYSQLCHQNETLNCPIPSSKQNKYLQFFLLPELVKPILYKHLYDKSLGGVEFKVCFGRVIYNKVEVTQFI